MNIFKAIVIYLYNLITKGPKGIRKVNTEFLYDLLQENPTLEEFKEESDALHGIDINARFECNATLLSAAIEYNNNLEIIRLIVNKGFELNASDKAPLINVVNYLFENSDETKTVYYLDILKILLEAGADPNHKNSTDAIVGRLDEKPNNIALQIELLELFIEYGADLNLQDEDGRSILFYCKGEEEKAIKFLLENGANPNIKDIEGNTALQHYSDMMMIFYDYDFTSLVTLFLEHDWDLNSQNNKKQSFLFHMINDSERKKVISLLLANNVSLDIVDVNGKKAFDYATSSIKSLLRDAGATSVYTKLDKELLSLVTYWNSENNIEDVKKFLLQGANVNVSTKYNETPLYFAVYAEDITLVKLILSYKPNIDIVEENYGLSILHMAVSNDNVEIAKLLLEAEADVNIQGEDGTPLFYMKSLEMLKLFMRVEVNINAKDNSGKTVLSKIVTPYIKPGLIDDPEELVYDTNAVEKIELLLKEGIKLEEDNDGNTIFHDTARGGSVTFLKLLHKHRIPFNVFNNEKESPLQFAVKFGHFKAVKYLVELGVDINTIDEYGATALFEAGRYEHKFIEEYLLEKGADPKHLYNEENTEVVKGNIDYL